MSDRDRPAPLAPELVSLLDDEKARPDATSEVQQRLFSRLQESIAHLEGGGDDGGGDDGGGDDGGGASGAPTVAAPAGGAGVMGALSAHPVALAITALGIGGVLGASLHWAVSSRTPEPRVVYVDRTVTGPRASSAEAVPLREQAPLASSLAASPARLPTASSSAVRSSAGAGTGAGRSADGQLGGERAILEIARTALGRGDYESALETLDRHAQKYPAAQLAEEREALAIQCLVGLGRADAARARGERFKKSFPGSMLLPVVDSALR